MSQVQLQCAEAYFLLQVLEEKHEELLRTTAILDDNIRGEVDPVGLRVLRLAQRGLDVECQMISRVIRRIREGFRVELRWHYSDQRSYEP